MLISEVKIKLQTLISQLLLIYLPYPTSDANCIIITMNFNAISKKWISWTYTILISENIELIGFI